MTNKCLYCEKPVKLGKDGSSYCGLVSHNKCGLKKMIEISNRRFKTIREEMGWDDEEAKK